jgi:hypothetical protein
LRFVVVLVAEVGVYVWGMHTCTPWEVPVVKYLEAAFQAHSTSALPPIDLPWTKAPGREGTRKEKKGRSIAAMLPAYADDIPYNGIRDNRNS